MVSRVQVMVEAIAEYSPYYLAKLAELVPGVRRSMPAAEDSAGANFLECVRDDLIDKWEQVIERGYVDGENPGEKTIATGDHGAMVLAQEALKGFMPAAVDEDAWEIFHELRAWDSPAAVDVMEEGCSPGEDVTNIALETLSAVAVRLAVALAGLILEEYRPAKVWGAHVGADGQPCEFSETYVDGDYEYDDECPAGCGGNAVLEDPDE